MVILFGSVWKNSLETCPLCNVYSFSFLSFNLSFLIIIILIIRASLELEQSVVANLKEQMKQTPLNEKVSCTLYFY